MLQTYLEKANEEKKTMAENPIIAAQNYFCLLYIFQRDFFKLFLNIYLFYMTIFSFIDYLLFPCKTLHKSVVQVLNCHYCSSTFWNCNCVHKLTNW